MSARNRPRGSIAKEDFTDELNLWNSIVEKVRRAQALDVKYEEIQARIGESDQTIPDDEPAAAIPILENLSTLHREGLKNAEEEARILEEEPDDLIRNLEILISVRTAMEAEAPQPRERNTPSKTTAQPVKPAPGRNAKRKLDGIANDASIETATPPPSAGPMVSIDLPPKPPQVAVPAPKKGSRSSSMNIGKGDALAEPENIKNVASTTQPTFVIGNHVIFRQQSKGNANSSDEGEGIICKIKEIMGPAGGKARRYKVQDAEPESGETPPIFTTTADSLIAIPSSSAGLPALQKGKSVLAKYPETSTFYRAEVVGTGKKDICKLRFEGEDPPGKDHDVERRFVFTDVR